MRWVLIRPLNRSLFYDPEIQEPLGLEYLASALKESGGKVLILDSALDNLNDIKLARRAAAFQPDAVGFSITTDRELDSMKTIYAECKRILNEKSPYWIGGGNYVTCEYQNACKEFPPEFRLVRYEGEILIKKINSLGHDGRMDSLPRLTDGEPTMNLDDLPFPQRPYYYYLNHFGWAFNVQGSRGCCSACKYCASSGMRGAGSLPWRGRSPENIVSELAYLHQTCSALTFNFVDEDFLGPPARSLDRAKRLSAAIANACLHISFGIQVRPNSLSKEVIDALETAGLKYVFMGIESDNPDDFRRWGRSYCADTWHWVKYLQEKEIEINAGTLLFHPDSTFEGIRDFATKLHQHGLLNCRTAINRMDAMPGSFFYDEYLSAHPNACSQGITRLPFHHPAMESFFQTVLHVLEPIEAPSMHALCAMPAAQTNRIFRKSEKQYNILKVINLECDRHVSSCFFTLLEMAEKEDYSEQKIKEMTKNNIEFGKVIADRLVENGFVESPDALYQAIKV